MIVSLGQDLHAALVDQLSLVRRLVGAASDVRMIFTSDRGYFAQAAVGGLTVTSASSVPGPSRTRRPFVSSPLMAASNFSCHRATTAPPARLITVGPDGAIESPALLRVRTSQLLAATPRIDQLRPDHRRPARSRRRHSHNTSNPSVSGRPQEGAHNMSGSQPNRMSRRGFLGLAGAALQSRPWRPATSQAARTNRAAPAAPPAS